MMPNDKICPTLIVPVKNVDAAQAILTLLPLLNRDGSHQDPAGFSLYWSIYLPKAVIEIAQVIDMAIGDVSHEWPAGGSIDGEDWELAKAALEGLISQIEKHIL